MTRGKDDVTTASERFPALGEMLDFFRLLWALDHELNRCSKQMERTLGMSSQKRLVLRIVGRFPGIPAGHLARLLHVHPGTLTGVLQRLEGNGLLRRRPDPKDARRSLLGLTQKGLEVDLHAEGLVERAVRGLVEGTPPEKLQSTREVLESLSARLAEVRSPDVAEPSSTEEACS